ncbi:MAG TPA: type II toxin-antitoxin system prevent-host-death family antitoxin [Kutzneria sp.]|jgi:prevent-host-death family protein
MAKKTEQLSMRELTKLTVELVKRYDEPVQITNNGLPVAWLVPLTESDRQRAELIAAGRLRPGRHRGLSDLLPLPPEPDGPTLSELLLEMRAQERA